MSHAVGNVSSGGVTGVQGPGATGKLTQAPGNFNVAQASNRSANNVGTGAGYARAMRTPTSSEPRGRGSQGSRSPTQAAQPNRRPAAAPPPASAKAGADPGATLRNSQGMAY